MRSLLLTLLFSGWFFSTNSHAQDAPLSRRGKENFDKAQKAWQTRQLNEAMALFEKVEETDQNIIITVKENNPAADAMVTQVITYPYTVVRIHSKKEIIIK